MEWLERWGPLFVHFIAAAAEGIIVGSRAAGVTHETVATTVSKIVLGVTSNGVAPGTAERVPRAVPPPVP